MLTNMRILATTLLAAALVATPASSEPLSSADREALLESLEKIRESADSKVDARFRLAIAAYREAMSTDDAAMGFYLKCIEKVNFEDQQKKSAEFREWKRREGDKLSEQGFRLALRYQLRWLILTLRAESEKTRSAEIVGEAQEVVDSIFRDAVKLGEYGQTLGQPVTSTVFARAYEIGNVENAKWPLSPIQLEQVYNEIIFPLYRNPSGIASLRAAWIKRIQQEGIKEEAMGGNGGGGGGGGGRRNGQPEPREGGQERFMMETLPELQWQMELDLFRSGDEGGAAVRMLEHIQKHLNHRSARDWGDQFKNLLSPKPPPAATTAGG